MSKEKNNNMKNTISKLINQTNNDIQRHQNQLKLMEDTLMNANMVVAFPETLLTVKVNRETNKAEINMGPLPTQYTWEDAITIVKSVKNGRDESPSIFPVKDYYNAYIKMQKSFLTQLTNSENNLDKTLYI